MTDDNLAEIRRRLEGATPGPWRVEADENGAHIVADRVPEHPYPSFSFCVAEMWDYPLYDVHRTATFIAHAPEDIAALLAENERLRTARTHLQGRAVGHFQPQPVVVEATIGVKRGARHPYHWTADCEYIGVAAPCDMEGCGDGMIGTGETRSEAIIDCLRRTLEDVPPVGERLFDDIRTFEPRLSLVVHIVDQTPREALVTRAERQMLGPEPTRAETEISKGEE